MMHLTFIQKMHSALSDHGFNATNWEIRSVDAVESTNDYVDQLLEVYDKAITLSKIQTKGKGREGSDWLSPEGGVWLSIGIKEEMEMMELSTPVVKTVQSVLSEFVDCQVKPPNDVLIDGNKVCGVLVETESEADKITQLIVGIGINVVNEIPEEIQDIATRLADHCDPPSVEDLGRDVAIQVIEKLTDLVFKPTK